MTHVEDHPYADRWLEPSKNSPELVIYNTLTRSKVPFRPQNGSSVRWYNCGPTVYDASHIGHARNYVTFDIIRRIMENYFNYDVTLIMNITDVDDKIIIRARHAFLVEKFKKEHELIDDLLLKELGMAWSNFIKDKLNTYNEGEWKDLGEEMKKADEGIDAKKLMNFNMASKAFDLLNEAKLGEKADNLINSFHDILAIELDAKYGSSITDQKIFRDLAAFWEKEFLDDMKALNVRPASLMTRVTEFVPQIIECVERILANGYAYEAQGSVYFDVGVFHEKNGHLYAKLCPWSAGNCKFFEEGEGMLGVKLLGKRDPRDFALWKASKSGEPFWDSPWGQGRPGWHIECSAMAAAVAPGTLDIHSGGIDLAFPHHDNELAQSEAFYESPQWVNYFLHAGHVHIEGYKMSKSLKNFITIREALSRYSARQLRIMFLQHHWHAPVYYKESSMTTAAAVESLFVNFFSNIAANVRSFPAMAPECSVGPKELKLLSRLTEITTKVHTALCDNFDTPSVLLFLQELINSTNIYIQDQARPNAYVLRMVGKYVRKILKVFGLVEDSEEDVEFGNRSESDTLVGVNSILEIVAEYRDKVRSIALEKKLDPVELLRVSDEVRNKLSDFGVVFEDRPGRSTLVKLLDRETMARQKQELASREEEKLSRKLEMTRIYEAKQAQKLAKACIDPATMFKDNPAYSRFDSKGIPTHDVEGMELGKNPRKKLIKEYETQLELHQKFLYGGYNRI